MFLFSNFSIKKAFERLDFCMNRKQKRIWDVQSFWRGGKDARNEKPKVVEIPTKMFSITNFSLEQ